MDYSSLQTSKLRKIGRTVCMIREVQLVYHWSFPVKMWIVSVKQYNKLGKKVGSRKNSKKFRLFWRQDRVSHDIPVKTDVHVYRYLHFSSPGKFKYQPLVPRYDYCCSEIELSCLSIGAKGLFYYMISFITALCQIEHKLQALIHHSST